MRCTHPDSMPTRSRCVPDAAVRSGTRSVSALSATRGASDSMARSGSGILRLKAEATRLTVAPGSGRKIHRPIASGASANRSTDGYGNTRNSAARNSRSADGPRDDAARSVTACAR